MLTKTKPPPGGRSKPDRKQRMRDWKEKFDVYVTCLDKISHHQCDGSLQITPTDEIIPSLFVNSSSGTSDHTTFRVAHVTLWPFWTAADSQTSEPTKTEITDLQIFSWVSGGMCAYLY